MRIYSYLRKVVRSFLYIQMIVNVRLSYTNNIHLVYTSNTTKIQKTAELQINYLFINNLFLTLRNSTLYKIEKNIKNKK